MQRMGCSRTPEPHAGMSQPAPRHNQEKSPSRSTTWALSLGERDSHHPLELAPHIHRTVQPLHRYPLCYPHMRRIRQISPLPYFKSVSVGVSCAAMSSCPDGCGKPPVCPLQCLSRPHNPARHAPPLHQHQLGLLFGAADRVVVAQVPSKAFTAGVVSI